MTPVRSGPVPAPRDSGPHVGTQARAGLPDAPFGEVPAFVVPQGTAEENGDWPARPIAAGAETERHRQRAPRVRGTTFDILGPGEANAIEQRVSDFLGPVPRRIGRRSDDQ